MQDCEVGGGAPNKHVESHPPPPLGSGPGRTGLWVTWAKLDVDNKITLSKGSKSAPAMILPNVILCVIFCTIFCAEGVAGVAAVM